MIGKDKETGREPAGAGTPRSIVDPRAIEKLKRRAEDLGLIIHHRREQDSAQPDRKKGGKR